MDLRFSLGTGGLATLDILPHSDNGAVSEAQTRLTTFVTNLMFCKILYQCTLNARRSASMPTLPMSILLLADALVICERTAYEGLGVCRHKLTGIGTESGGAGKKVREVLLSLDAVRVNDEVTCYD